MDRKGWIFTKDDSIHLFYMCMTIEDGMGCQKYQEFTKVSQTQKLTNVLDFHESKMIHGR
jgi:hypothetical protein